MPPSATNLALLSNVSSLDPRIARSRQAVGKALMLLLKEGNPYSRVTVSVVAARAGITRKTFYAHFESVDAVVRALAYEIFKDTLEGIDDEDFVLPASSSEIGASIFRRLQGHLDTLEPLATLCPSTLFLDPAREAVETIVFARFVAINDLGPIDEFDRDYLAHLVGTIVYGALTAWASRGFTDDPDDVGDFVVELVGPVADRVFASAKRKKERS